MGYVARLIMRSTVALALIASGLLLFGGTASASRWRLIRVGLALIPRRISLSLSMNANIPAERLSTSLRAILIAWVISLVAGCVPTINSKPQWVDGQTSMTMSDSIESTIEKLGKPMDAQSSGNNLALVYCRTPSFGEHEHFVVWFQGRTLKSASRFLKSPNCGSLKVDWGKTTRSNTLKANYVKQPSTKSSTTFSNAMSEGLDRQLEILQDSQRRNKDDWPESKKSYRCTPDLLGNFNCN